jgi:hypothetical protein
MVDSVEMIRFFASLRMTNITNSPITTQPPCGGGFRWGGKGPKGPGRAPPRAAQALAPRVLSFPHHKGKEMKEPE